MKVYVVNCFYLDEDSNLYSHFVETCGVFTDKYHSYSWIEQEKLHDLDTGNDCSYIVEEFNI